MPEPSSHIRQPNMAPAREPIRPLTFEQYMERLGWDLQGHPYKCGRGKIVARGKGGAHWDRDADKALASGGWTPELIEQLLQTNPRACERALLVLWEAQTEQERRRGETFVSNDVGFTGSDAPKMSEMARQVAEGNALQPPELRWLRAKAPRSKFSRLGKYHAQLIAAIARRQGQ